MAKNKTQKYIDKYCEYIDKILVLWDDLADKFDIQPIVQKAEFIHYLLGINKKIDRFNGDLIDHNIGFLSYDLSEHDEESYYYKKTSEEMKFRKEHFENCKKKALSIRSISIKEVESSSYNKPDNNEELNGLLYSLRQIKKALDCNVIIDPLEGKNANRLLIEYGFASKWLILAIETGIVPNKILPYPVKPNKKLLAYCFTLEEPEYFIEPFHTDKAIVSKWIKKVTDRIEHSNSEKLNIAEIKPIPIDEKRLMAFADGNWYKITVRACEILKKLNQEPGRAYTGEELKVYPDSNERPDKIIGRMPEAIRKRINNTYQQGYHLI